MNTQKTNTQNRLDRLKEADKQYLWHPFTQMKEWVEDTPLIIEEGRECFVRDIQGAWYLDGVSSLWVNLHGHRRKEIDDAIKGQLDKIAHTTLLGLGNVPAIELAQRLVGLLGYSFNGKSPVLTKVFYSDNGSTSVEVALKMAFQYWKHKGVKGRELFLSLNNAYHGDTLGAVSVGGVDIFHRAFGPLLFTSLRAPSPYCYRCELSLEPSSCCLACAGKVEELLKLYEGQVAAVIVEPLIQCAGGMIVAPAGYLKAVRELCLRYGTLFIADEVATGFGRTGRMFACEHEGVVPDILCLSKGITGGYLPLAVTVATEEVYRTFLGDFADLKTFFHGHSYTGNPLACAAALASLDIFEKDDTLGHMQPKVAMLEEWLKKISAFEHVGDVRSIGLMAGVELVRDRNTKEPYDYGERKGWAVALAARKRGVLIRPLGNVVVIMPPLAISRENLEAMLDQIESSIREAL